MPNTHDRDNAKPGGSTCICGDCFETFRAKTPQASAAALDAHHKSGECPGPRKSEPAKPMMLQQAEALYEACVSAPDLHPPHAQIAYPVAPGRAIEPAGVSRASDDEERLLWG
jgi:hypothetical protein